VTPSKTQHVDGHRHIDQAGVWASSLCALHCMVAALIPALLSALGLGLLFGHVAEWLFTIIALVFASSALVLGWRRHRSRLGAALLALGIMGLLASRGIEMSGGGHHATHAHHATHHVEHDAHSDEGLDHGAHHAEEPAHEEEHDSHTLGTVVGVLAGLMLLFGHMVNLSVMRRDREGRR
jgi:hypothetical protein